MDPALARSAHRTLEPYHGIVYFAAEPQEAYEALGLAGRSGYFASRSAAMGAVDAEVVVATFFNFHPELVRRAMAGVWDATTPQEVLDARHGGIDATLRRILGDAVASGEVAEALELARRAATDLPISGRPLFAAHAGLHWPDEPHLALWHALTLLREFRGDGHLVALLDAGIASGCEALVSHASVGDVPAGVLRSSRAWPEDEWAAAEDALRARGWIDDEGAATEAGRAAREAIERRTDELAMAAWSRLDEPEVQRLRELVRPLSRAIVASGELGRPPASSPRG
ncbi:SCO6745 family protein [Actinomarinicola tropica]|uniref:SalK n=1 Tax=Actinomarinicola tropica TaxID=2789776 RepID=A0A5Q2RHT5_9ACTN|nr:hypothetical protein [Actinomarinicola tropica]QGG95363.1 hypothetical protein GH723_09780 [Actinomarinicola tropica]